MDPFNNEDGRAFARTSLEQFLTRYRGVYEEDTALSKAAELEAALFEWFGEVEVPYTEKVKELTTLHRDADVATAIINGRVSPLFAATHTVAEIRRAYPPLVPCSRCWKPEAVLDDVYTGGQEPNYRLSCQSCGHVFSSPVCPDAEWKS